ncbi:hypothetical protein IMCC21906_02498 [Spongiibacter sp. IMCC21906]|nr:hypothetical protein IMCC21906_02498 [Spongiibacter sp. IMCC21906]
MTSPETACNVPARQAATRVISGCCRILLCCFSVSGNAEILGYAGLQTRWFPDTALEPQQKDTAYSMVVAPEWYQRFNNNDDSVNVKLFYRHDSADDKRSHGDIREAYWQHVGQDYEFSLGINKLFWGVTESQHLVDIVNQTDLVEAPDGEEKLGQTMAHLALLQDWGVVDIILLPGFRERSFAGENGRLRSIPLTIEDGRFDSGAGDKHSDAALRWSHYLGDVSLGISSFWGTSREPLLEVATNNGNVVLQPFYPQIFQNGLTAQYIVGDWIWKLETIYREYLGDTQGIDFFASTSGVEKAIVGIWNNWDLGVLAEYSQDSRGNEATSLYQNDLFIGGRLSFNDIAGSEILAGVVQDLSKAGSQLAFVEASTRLGSSTRLSLEFYYFSAEDNSAPLFLLRRDSFVELAIDYYF